MGCNVSLGTLSKMPLTEAILRDINGAPIDETNLKSFQNKKNNAKINVSIVSSVKID